MNGYIYKKCQLLSSVKNVHCLKAASTSFFIIYIINCLVFADHDLWYLDYNSQQLSHTKHISSLDGIKRITKMDKRSDVLHGHGMFMAMIC